MWSDTSSGRIYPEGMSLSGTLLSREPSTVTAPLDYVGLGDNRIAVASQRAGSWTDTQYKFQGMDATDSYQPGIPVMIPDVQAIAVAVRNSFAQAGSSGGGTEVDLYMRQAGPSWHGTVKCVRYGHSFRFQ